MITREFFNRVSLDLIEALYILPIEEIEETRRDWLAQLNRAGISPKVIEFCNKVTDVVIESKQEEERRDVLYEK